MIKRIIVVLTLIVLVLKSVPAIGAVSASPAEPVIAGAAALVLDAENGQVLYGKSQDRKMYPASTTKIVTALVALEMSSPDDMVEVSRQAAEVAGSRVGLQPGERLPMEHLLYMLMLNSANDAAVAIAEHVGGSVQGFAELMNRRAGQLGARHTNFTNPHGLPDANHYSTARDLAVIGRGAMQNDTFQDIAGTTTIKLGRKEYMSPEVLRRVEKLEQIHGPLQEDFYNHNRLLTQSYNGYKGANGIKTGYTAEAGQCIVASARRDGREMIAVVLNSRGASLWADAAALLDYGFDGFTPVELVTPRQMITDTAVKNGADRATLETAEYFYYNFPLGRSPEVTRQVELPDNIVAPLEAGQKVGELVLESQGRELGRVPLANISPVPRSLTSYPWWPLLGVPVFLLLLYGMIRRRRNRRSRPLYLKQGYRR
ncbi:MAG: D-alanyl-D-alanine carboxypeptidase [Firmicutes bacterium]|nr:D-alanyl-D-alanine carboxypeptidase [Bacillota bacterium]